MVPEMTVVGKAGRAVVEVVGFWVSCFGMAAGKRRR